MSFSRRPSRPAPFPDGKVSGIGLAARTGDTASRRCKEPLSGSSESLFACQSLHLVNTTLCMPPRPVPTRRSDISLHDYKADHRSCHLFSRNLPAKITLPKFVVVNLNHRFRQLSLEPLQTESLLALTLLQGAHNEPNHNLVLRDKNMLECIDAALGLT